MFTVEKIEFFKSASETSSTINLEARRECENIMKQIYDENPSYWPYGLDLSSHDGGVYMIREASTHKPVGFTGWQERKEGNNKVGYYSIGILPEYRNNGYAKQAVAKLISLKSANVDKVKALVMQHNKPSLALAESLHIPVEKSANVAKVLSGLGTVGKTVAPAIFMDVFNQHHANPNTSYLDSVMDKDKWDTFRTLQLIANLGFGGAATKGQTYLRDVANIPMKDVALAGTAALYKHMNEDGGSTPGSSAGGLSAEQKLALGLGGLVAAGIGYKGVSALSNLAKAQQQKAKGRVTVTLPTKNPGDKETYLELPMEDESISSAQLEKLQRDVRRRLRKETTERTEKRKDKEVLEPKEACAKNVSLDKIKFLINSLNG